MSVCKPFVFYDENAKLPEVYGKRARKDLGEDEKQLSAHLESFRRWLKSMPHLKCPTDDSFLMAFLRHAKFNHMKAQTRLDNFCTFRTSESEGAPEWFVRGEKRNEMWKKFMDLECYLPLGHLTDGTLCAFMQFAKCDLSKIDIGELFGGVEILYDLLLIDPRMQIAGVTIVMDATGLTNKMVMSMWKPKESKLNTKYFQECLPFRIGKIVYYNISPAFEKLFNLMSIWLTDKIKSKVIILKDDLQPAFDKISGLKELMPKDVGGTNHSFETLLKSARKTMDEVPVRSPGFDIHVNEAKRPMDSRNLMKTYKDLPSDIMGTSGTYIKLNDDDV